ncbi:transglutaminase-like putative cysteine protease [Humitalea rosea]|uniref:Transglutaminase-like putative cysteine protease n=1 Tax=Humitalea rosea TaxID=990373 RepID=A0A2W7IGG1_9PROT|nr:transglutaminase family protein [Humitalea rosea]PZW44742.1 transglutaminase-like putative cysteine protease [Humitalea rosea]
MTSRWRLRHATTYTYARPVDMATHMLHLTPREMPGQKVLSATIRSVPEAARITTGTDHFGNVVSWLFLDRPHERFEVISEAEVESGFPPPPAAETTPPWERVVAEAAGEVAEFLFESPLVPIVPAARAFAAQSFPPGRPVLEGLLEVMSRIRREFTYRPGVTGISTSVEHVMTTRAGVCQDFSHAMISGLRGLGLPARYVSGYIRTYTPPGRVRMRGADQSHAWVGAWMGPEHGWVDLDPTNDCVVSTEHVVLGWGRDFSDVSPLRGVILGGGRHTLHVGVDLEPAES